MPFSTLHREHEDDESSLDRPAADRRDPHIRRHGVSPCGATRREGAGCRPARGRRPDRARRRPRPAAPGRRDAAGTPREQRRRQLVFDAWDLLDRRVPLRSGGFDIQGRALNRVRYALDGRLRNGAISAARGAPSSTSISSASTTRTSATRALCATAVSGADDRPATRPSASRGARARRALVALLGALLTEFASATALEEVAGASGNGVVVTTRNPARARRWCRHPTFRPLWTPSPRCTPTRSRSASPAHAASGRTARRGKLIPIDTAVENGHRAPSEARTLRFTRCPCPRQ